MADSSFREEQEKGTYAPHMRAINELVDELRDVDGRGGMPYVAPWHGGAEARVLSVLRDPGKTLTSGFLCTENDDETSERQAVQFEEAGVAARDVTPWNAYPWQVRAAPRAAQLNEGVEPLLRVIGLMPQLRVVLLQGTHARDSWQRLEKQAPDLVERRGLTVLWTYHPGRQAIWHADPEVVEFRKKHRADTYAQVSEALAGTRTDVPPPAAPPPAPVAAEPAPPPAAEPAPPPAPPPAAEPAAAAVAQAPPTLAPVPPAAPRAVAPASADVPAEAPRRSGEPAQERPIGAEVGPARPTGWRRASDALKKAVPAAGALVAQGVAAWSRRRRG